MQEAMKTDRIGDSNENFNNRLDKQILTETKAAGIIGRHMVKPDNGSSAEEPSLPLFPPTSIA